MSFRPATRIERLAVRLLVPGAALAATAGLAAVALASAPGPMALRLESVRIAGGRQSVEVIARFSGGNVPVGIVMTTDANPFDGRATVTVPAPRISTAVARAQGAGLRVRVTARSGRLTFALESAPRAITYVGYRKASSGRLVLVLWRSTPPSAGSHPRFGPAGCLTLRANVRGATIRASGSESQLFEHSFVVRLRARDGRLVAQRVVTAVGHWAVTLPFAARAGRVATLEAFAGSAKDGSLACLAQQRVTRA
jgi:hypothetical protein